MSLTLSSTGISGSGSTPASGFVGGSIPSSAIWHPPVGGSYRYTNGNLYTQDQQMMFLETYNTTNNYGQTVSITLQPNAEYYIYNYQYVNSYGGNSSGGGTIFNWYAATNSSSISLALMTAPTSQPYTVSGLVFSINNSSAYYGATLLAFRAL